MKTSTTLRQMQERKYRSSWSNSPILPFGAMVLLLFFVPRLAQAQAVFTVNSVANIAADNGFCNATECTLDEAIQAANAHTNIGGVPDRIEFSIGSGAVTYTPGDPLTEISDPVVIDGTTQPGYSGIPLISVSGDGGTDDLFDFTGGSTTIKGLIIFGSGEDGITITVNGGNTVQNCYILTNDESGIEINGSSNNLIGGDETTERNVIEDNTGDGILVTGALAKNNQIQGNYIGLEPDGSTIDANARGIGIAGGASLNTIGGTSTGEGNIISGNTAAGVEIDGSFSNTVVGNIIGLGADGTTDKGNTTDGVLIDNGAFSNTIGGTDTGAGNVISGNTQSGIEINAAFSNTVQGNYIGTNAPGTAAVANSIDGVLIASSSSLNTIGGTTSSARNVISGNTESGIEINASSSNTVQGNYIGTDKTGAVDLGNTLSGVLIQDASQNTIGGTVSGAGNVVSGNNGGGVDVFATGAAVEDNSVSGNLIGTQSDGSSALGNTGDGVRIRNANNRRAAANTIGGTASGAGNTIAYNSDDGVAVEEGADTDGVDNPILANSIFQNGGSGIDLESNGLTANDVDDPDAAANQAQNFPILSLVSSGSTIISGTLNSRPSASYRVEFFSVPTPDGDGFGEGKVFLGSTDVTTDGGGDATFTATVSTSLTSGTYVTSTATALDTDNTTPLRSSEFSKAVTVGTNTIVVNTIDNTDDLSCDALDLVNNLDCTLHEAIDLANLTVGIVDEITFDIPGAGPHTIVIGATTLPTITDPVVIDGTTEPDYAGTPVVEITGGTAASGLTISAGSSTVRGLAITSFTGGFIHGIVLTTNGDNVIEMNYIGIDTDGTTGRGNAGNGIQVDSNNNTIGGSSSAERNVISGNVNNGITIIGESNTVQYNYIGTSAGGDLDVGNGGHGIALSTADDNTVANNVVSGNGAVGVIVSDASVNNDVKGNYIGTSADGASDLGNSSHGILISVAANNNTIGGTTSGDRNVISGNGLNGIRIDGTTTDVTGTIIQGNYIGITADGNAELGNEDDGILINNGSNNNTVGGSTSGARNVISGNGEDGSGSGVSLDDDGTDSNIIRGNYIGTNAAGTAAIPNTDFGVSITDAADNNTVGGTSSGAGNVVSGNSKSGILIDGPTSPTGNLIRGNWIGLKADGTTALGNTDHGVLIDDGDDNFIGGTASGAGNSIAYNGKDGIAITGGGDDNALQRNPIYGNSGHSIDLGDNGVTLNDVDDADAGENELQNFPVLTQAAANSSTTSVQGSLNSEVSKTYRIEFFSTPSLGSTGQREVRVFLGSTTVTTDAGGDVNFMASLSSSVADGHFVLATATDQADNQTSELSAPVQATNTGGGFSNVSLNCTLGSGWDWFSINVDPSNTAVNNVLAGLGPATNDIIKNPNTGDFSVWDGGSWVGLVSTITAGPGYKIKLTNQGSIAVTGPATTATQSIVSGWNSIGFLKQSSQSVGTYLSPITEATNDLVKDEDGNFSVYDGTQWVGLISTLAPCEGYMLKVQNAGTLSKTFGASSPTVSQSTSSPEWNVNPADFEHSMSMIGVLELDGRSPVEAADKMAAFSGDEVRGIAQPVEVNGTTMFFLTVFGRSDGEQISFKVYDSVSDAVRESDRPISFGIDALYGSTSEPYTWRAAALATSIEDREIPKEFELGQNYPNPFNPVTLIRYALAQDSDVTLDVFDLHGRKVRTLVSTRQTAGRYEFEWDGRGGSGERVATGVYLYRLQAGQFTHIRKMILLK